MADVAIATCTVACLAIWMTAAPVLFAQLGLTACQVKVPCCGSKSVRQAAARVALASAVVLSIVGPAPWLVLGGGSVLGDSGATAIVVAALALAHVGAMLALLGGVARTLLHDRADVAIAALACAGGRACPQSARNQPLEDDRPVRALSAIPSWLSSHEAGNVDTGEDAAMPAPIRRSLTPTAPAERAATGADSCASSLLGVGPYLLVALLTAATAIAVWLPELGNTSAHESNATATPFSTSLTGPMLGAVTCYAGAAMFALGLLPMCSAAPFVWTLATQLNERAQKQLDQARQRRSRTIMAMLARIEERAVRMSSIGHRSLDVEEHAWQADRARASVRAQLQGGDDAPAAFLGSFSRQELLVLASHCDKARPAKRMRRRSAGAAGGPSLAASTPNTLCAVVPAGATLTMVAPATLRPGSPTAAGLLSVDTGRQSRHSSFSVSVTPLASLIAADRSRSRKSSSTDIRQQPSAGGSHLLWQLRGREALLHRAEHQHALMCRAANSARARVRVGVTLAAVATLCAFAGASLLAVPVLTASDAASLQAACLLVCVWGMGGLSTLVFTAAVLGHARIGTFAFVRRVLLPWCGRARSTRVTPRGDALPGPRSSRMVRSSRWSTLPALPAAGATSESDWGSSMLGIASSGSSEAPLSVV